MPDNLKKIQKQNHPLVSIIILCWNKVELTRACIAQLISITPPDMYELIVVDNASSDDTRPFLMELRQNSSVKNLRLLVNNENLGFVGGNNQAAKIAKGKYLVFLNNDTKPCKGWLEALTSLPEKDPVVGAVGAKLVFPDGRLQEAGGIIYNDATGCNYGKFQDPDLPGFNYVREVDYCSGACLLVRKELFLGLGGFDTRYSPAYYEDTDLCFALRDMGYRVLYQPRAVVEHFEGGTAGTDINSGAKRYQQVNHTKFLEKWRTALQSQYPPPSNRIEAVRSSERIRGRKVLVAHEVPQAFDRASGALRIHNLIRLLVENGHHVTYACLNSGIHDGVDLAPYVAAMQDMGVFVLPLDRFRNPDAEFLQQLAIRDYDSAFLPFYYCAQRFIPMIREISPRTRIVIDSVDVHFLRQARQEFLEGVPESWAAYSATMNRELAAYREADAVLTVTEKDKEKLEQYLATPPVFSVSDPHNAHESTPSFNERRDIVFLAGFRHTPNVDAALYFRNEIWPMVLELLPDARWYILGDAPPPEIQALACDNIIVTGYVPSLDPYLRKARVAVAPLRFGAGMKGKIACSLAHGLPCVSTLVGAEGMGLVHGENVMVADDPADFAGAVARLYSDEELWGSISVAGKEHLNSTLGEGVIYPRFSRALELEKKRPAYQIDFSDQVAAAGNVSRGYRLLTCGAPDLAEIFFRKHLSHRPEDLNVTLALALAMAKGNKVGEALSTMKQVLEKNGMQATHIAYLAIIFKLSNNHDKALESFLAAFAADPDNGWIVAETASYLKSVLAADNGAKHLLRFASGGRDVIAPLMKHAFIRERKHDIQGSCEALKAAMELAEKTGDEKARQAIKQRIDELIEKLRRKTDAGDSPVKPKANPVEDSRKSQEIAYYAEVTNVHDLPEIYHYWSNKYLLPKLKRANLGGLDDLFLRYLRFACGSDNPYFLSMGSGNCEYEISLASRLVAEGHTSFIFECIDINKAMLARGKALADSSGVGGLFVFTEADVNSWQPKTGCSVIMANHSLHHFVELEMLFDKVALALGSDGVFLTNDMIGRNGHMRWPEAMELLLEIWKIMPDRYKFNHQLNRLESTYENWDCSKEGFEGIRSQDILPLLADRFNFEVFIAFNNITGIFVDRCFGHNFDVNNPDDLRFIDSVAEIDETQISAGRLKPTQLIAAMRAGSIREELKHHNMKPSEAIRWPGC